MCPTAANYTKYPRPSVTERTDVCAPLWDAGIIYQRSGQSDVMHVEFIWMEKRCEVWFRGEDRRDETQRQTDARLTWRWCWCRWCTRSRLNTGSGRWSCWFWWASILGSSSWIGTWPTEPVLSASLPKQNKRTKQQFTSQQSTFVRPARVNTALKDKQTD